MNEISLMKLGISSATLDQVFIKPSIRGDCEPSSSGHGNLRCPKIRARATPEEDLASGYKQPKNSSFGKKYYVTAKDFEALGTQRTAQEPWDLSFQSHERNIVWSDDLQERLLKRIASDSLNISLKELEDRISDLADLIPDLRSKIPSMKASLLIELATDLRSVAQRMVQLKRIVPNADASVMVSNRPVLVTKDDLDLFEQRMGLLRAALPGVQVDAMVQDFPALLEIRDMAGTMQHVGEMFGCSAAEAVTVVRRDPNVLFQAQRGAGLIAYDDPTEGSDVEMDPYFRM